MHYNISLIKSCESKDRYLTKLYERYLIAKWRCLTNYAAFAAGFRIISLGNDDCQVSMIITGIDSVTWSLRLYGEIHRDIKPNVKQIFIQTQIFQPKLVSNPRPPQEDDRIYRSVFWLFWVKLPTSSNIIFIL